MSKINYTVIKESLEIWKKQTGVADINNPGLDIKTIVNEMDAHIDEMTAEELSYYINKLLSYSIFLKTEKSKIASRLKLLVEQYKRILYSDMAKFDGQFMTKDEKETRVTLANNNLIKIKDEIVDQEIKFEQIRDLPQSIDAKARMLEGIYRTKQRRQYGKV